jgi:hypothetical protein
MSEAVSQRVAVAQPRHSLQWDVSVTAKHGVGTPSTHAPKMLAFPEHGSMQAFGP